LIGFGEYHTIVYTSKERKLTRVQTSGKSICYTLWMFGKMVETASTTSALYSEKGFYDWETKFIACIEMEIILHSLHHDGWI
jgi:hypothetical protein